MKEISIYEQYDYFANAFNNIGTFLLSSDVQEIDYCIFEEFDGDCISFLNDNILSILLDHKLISETVYCLSIELARKFRNMENTSSWNSESVKSSPHWLEILIIADKIKSLIVVP